MATSSGSETTMTSSVSMMAAPVRIQNPAYCGSCSCIVFLPGAKRELEAEGWRGTLFPPARQPRSGVHRLVVVEAQPALDDAVDHPHGVGEEHGPADEDDHQDDAHHRPQQPEPEGPDLPAEMAFQEGPGDVVLLDVVHHDRDDRGDADQNRGCVERVDEGGDRLCRSFDFCFGYSDVFHCCCSLVVYKAAIQRHRHKA